MACPVCCAPTYWSSMRVKVCHGCRTGDDAAECLAEFIEDMINGDGDTHDTGLRPARKDDE